MRSRTTRVVLAVAMAGLTTMMIPSPAGADTTLGGFVANASATPLQIQIIEPAIPIPADPQVQLEFGYSETDASSGPNGHGRASWLWPGDSIGEGFKTIGDGLGLPAALTKNGYPVQVNSNSPGDVATQSSTLAPGATMRTTSGPKETVASVGYSPDDAVSDDSDAPPAATGAGGLPGIPALPSIPGFGGLTDILGSLLGAPKATPPAPAAGGATSSDTNNLALPSALSAIVDFGGMSSISRSTYDGDTIVAQGTSSLTDFSLLAGIIKAESVVVSTTTTSTLSKTSSVVKAQFGSLSIAGQSFAITKDGIVAAGNTTALPALPDALASTLALLGITFELPKAVKTVNGTREAVAVQGLKITVDTNVLRKALDTLQLAKLIASLPDSAGALKSLAGALVDTPPKIVIYLGNANSEAGAVPTVAIPTVPSSGGPGTSTSGVPGSSGTLPPGGLPSTDLPTGTTVPVDLSSSPTAVAKVAGLPPLGSVPGMLLLAGLLVAAGLGWWLTKFGALGLGTSAMCKLGLQTGVPDLRKA
ncbi:MAG: hypothetical protein JWR35_1951 [Marmoricola sp.]|nr:hypothetical protein [Marmoricola sp.]